MLLEDRNSAIWDAPSMYWTPAGANADEERICRIRTLSPDRVVLEAAEAPVGTEGYVGTGRGQSSKAVVEEIDGPCATARFVDPGEGFREAVAQMVPAVEGRERYAPRRPSALKARVNGLADLLERRIERQVDTRQVLFELGEHPWTRALLERAPEIRSEFLGVVETFGTESIKETADDAGAGPGWRVFPIASLGRRIDFTAAYCPVTASLVEQVPNLIFASYSILLPGQSIPLHRARTRMNLRFHLGLVVLEGDIGIEIDGVTHRWREGEGFIFDDRKYHQAWNASAAPRAILMVDFPRSLAGIDRAVARAYTSLYVRFMNPELSSMREWQERVQAQIAPPPQRSPQTA